LDGFENKDALLNETFKKKPKNLKAAQAEEHGGQDELFKVYTERAWPECDVIVGNPPFLGDKFMRRELGDDYVEELREVYGNRIPGQSDLCCYWFEKARQQIEDGKCKRAGLLATQGIRGGANREVLKRIKETGGIFFAISERPWILAGANVAISMVGFDGGSESEKTLDGATVAAISSQLNSQTDVTKASKLAENSELSFIGASMHGPFPIEESTALDFLQSPNPSGLPSSDVVRLWCNGLSIVQRQDNMWLIDVPPNFAVEQAALYEKPFEYLRKHVLPIRENNRRAMRRKNWWLLGDPQKAMRAAVFPISRYLATPRVAKHRLFVWMPTPVLATDQVIAIARDDYLFQGLLQSRIHENWALRQCTAVGGNTPRYGPSQCFETFPLPRPTPDQKAAIAVAAKELNELRERWLNPPEWTQSQTLEFPGSVGGPWSRYIDPKTVDAKTGVGTVRYPRLEPRDADCAAKLARRTLTNLYNERPAWLDMAHKKLDAAVAAAYGFPADLPDDEILSRLLALNLERAAEEAKSTPAKEPKTSRQKQADEMI
jgi:type II restriction/modification system DNA methylase subunit YeeA